MPIARITAPTVAKTSMVRYRTLSWSYEELFKDAQSNGFAGALSRKNTKEVRGMPQEAWSDKRERQYEHIKEGLLERGSGEEKAEEIAARTVNKERARHGETMEASRTSIQDISSGRRGGLRSHRGSGGPTYDQLRNEAKARGIRGRSRMNKAQLEKVLSR